MALPSALIVERFRAFRAEQTLLLRPLTLVFGRNNAGKSALLRALALIGASLDDRAGSELMLPELAMRGAGFSDLAWQGEELDYSFTLGLQWGEGDLREARFVFNGGPERPNRVEELTLKGPDGRVIWAGLAPPGRPMRPLSGFEGPEIRFTGMVPRGPTPGPVRPLVDLLSGLRGQIQWLDGVRRLPRRRVPRTGVAPADLLPDGSNALEILVERPDLLVGLRPFYSGLRAPRELEVRQQLDVEYRVLLNPRGRESWSVELFDAGEGMAQVLPVLVGAAMLGQRARGGILAVEEPESHLHPDAAEALARHLCGLASQPGAPLLVLETHSRVFLLAVQVAVAEGLPPERVSLVWVDQDARGQSTVTPVPLGPSGHPLEGWPATALGDDLRLASRLADLGLRRARA